MKSFLLIISLLISNIFAISVPGDFNSIQDAIDASSHGDEILVSSGIYSENLIIEKNITIRGEDKSTTIIDGKSGYAVYFHQNSTAIFENFKITSSELFGGGIKINGASPDLNNLILEANKSDISGGAMYITRDGDQNAAEPHITNSIFRNNSSNFNGGAIFLGVNAYPLIKNCLFQSKYLCKEHVWSHYAK